MRTQKYITILLIIFIFCGMVSCGNKEIPTIQVEPIVKVKKQTKKQPQKKKKKPEYYEITSYSYPNPKSTKAPEYMQQAGDDSTVRLGGMSVNFMYGMWQPVGAFESKLEQSRVIGGTLVFQQLMQYVKPEMMFYYIKANGKDQEGGTAASLTMMQFFLGLKYGRPLVNLLNRNIMANLGTRCGMTSVNLQSSNTDQTQSDVVFSYGLAGGVTYDVFSWFALGVEANYHVVRTAGDNIQSRGLMLKGELRL